MDTNLLLVYFLGLYDAVSGYQIINSFRYTKGSYGDEDFEILSELLKRFDKRITTPHILAEVSNMLGQLREPARETCFGFLKTIVPSFEERTTSARELCGEPAFMDLGVADTGILLAALEPSGADRRLSFVRTFG